MHRRGRTGVYRSRPRPDGADRDPLPGRRSRGEGGPAAPPIAAGGLGGPPPRAPLRLRRGPPALQPPLLLPPAGHGLGEAPGRVPTPPPAAPHGLGEPRV